MADENKPLRILMCGGGAVGKTCFILRTQGHPFPEQYVPTVADEGARKVKKAVHGKTDEFEVVLSDSHVRDGSRKLFTLYFPHTALFLCCFSVVGRGEPLEDLQDPYLHLIQKHGYAHVPHVLMGLKTDLRCQPGDQPRITTTEQGRKLVHQLKERGHNCVAYVECSSLLNEGVEEAFQTVAEIAHDFSLGKKDGDKKKEHCVLL